MLKLSKYPPRGFTLIELLVVVLIIGILAAIALPQYERTVAKSRYSTLKGNAQSLAGSMERYYLVNNSYPQKYTDLDIEIQGAKESYSNTNYFYISMSNSYCVVWFNGEGSVGCESIILSKTMRFSIELSPKRMACIVWSKDSNDKANKFCQIETNRTTPYAGADYHTYYY